MKFTDFLLKTKEFLIKRLTELFGLIIIFASILILISLLSYSPNDPNFINSEIDEIQNILGFRGSILSDFIFQSVGLIGYLIPFTLFFSGTNILITKRQITFIDNLFYCILYIISGSLFFSYFYDQSFFLAVNGNGGFVGLFIKNSFLNNLLDINQNISYYALCFFVVIFFLISINFKITRVLNYIMFLKNIFQFKKKGNTEDIGYVNNQNINSETINENSRIQDTLPFESKVNKTIKRFILPDLSLLKLPSKNEKIAKNNEDINEDFLEKVLLDFGVEGKIKKNKLWASCNFK